MYQRKIDKTKKKTMNPRSPGKGYYRTSDFTDQKMIQKTEPKPGVSKVQKEAKEAENGNEEDEIADPRTGLTPRQVEAVQQSWERIGTGWRGNGPDFFVRYVRLYYLLFIHNENTPIQTYCKFYHQKMKIFRCKKFW